MLSFNQKRVFESIRAEVLRQEDPVTFAQVLYGVNIEDFETVEEIATECAKIELVNYFH